MTESTKIMGKRGVDFTDLQEGDSTELMLAKLGVKASGLLTVGGMVASMGMVHAGSLSIPGAGLVVASAVGTFALTVEAFKRRYVDDSQLDVAIPAVDELKVAKNDIATARDDAQARVAELTEILGRNRPKLG